MAAGPKMVISCLDLILDLIFRETDTERDGPRGAARDRDTRILVVILGSRHVVWTRAAAYFSCSEIFCGLPARDGDLRFPLPVVDVFTLVRCSFTHLSIF
jgi:hypothetical protein